MEDSGRIIALLIDAENVSPKYMDVILDELSLYGTPAYKRIYGDWTSVEMASWKKRLLENNLTPIQQFSYTQGKNSSDSAMIIDAMDILYAKNCDGFCIVSSDSDFTRLASRLRESRMLVIGMGESKTPTAFKAACDSFKYLDVLLNAKAPEKAPAEKTIKTNSVAKKPRKNDNTAKNKSQDMATVLENSVAAQSMQMADMHSEEQEVAALGFVPLSEIVRRIKNILEHDSDEDGYMPLAQVGSILGRQYADFDTRNYGFNKLHKLIGYTGEFETRCDETDGGGKNFMVRNK